MGNFEVRNPPKPPIWRDPRYLRSVARNRRFRRLLAILTAACTLFLAFPDDFDYDKAISYQLQAGGVSARLLFAAMGFTLLYMAVRLTLWRQFLGAFTAFVLFGGLVIIATTDPHSSLHNLVFLAIAAGLFAMISGLSLRHADALLGCAALACGVGLVLCFGHLGLGERVLVASGCLAMNGLYYQHLDP